jgi:hypothetical protein
MRLSGTTREHMSCVGSVSAWAILDAAPNAQNMRASRHPDGAPRGCAPVAGTAEEVYYGPGTAGMSTPISYMEKP